MRISALSCFPCLRRSSSYIDSPSTTQPKKSILKNSSGTFTEHTLYVPRTAFKLQFEDEANFIFIKRIESIEEESFHGAKLPFSKAKA